MVTVAPPAVGVRTALVAQRGGFGILHAQVRRPGASVCKAMLKTGAFFAGGSGQGQCWFARGVGVLAIAKGRRARWVVAPDNGDDPPAALDFEALVEYARPYAEEIGTFEPLANGSCTRVWYAFVTSERILPLGRFRSGGCSATQHELICKFIRGNN